MIIRGLTDGTYGVEVEAVDRALNASAPTTGNIPIGDPAKPQGLTQGAPLFSDTPVFLWTGPLLTGDIATYEIATADGGALGFPDEAFHRFDDPELFACVDSELIAVACPDVDDLQRTGDEIRVRFLVALDDQDYLIGVRVIDEFTARGAPATLRFTVDTVEPFAPADLDLVGDIPLRDDLVKADDRFPEFTWTPSEGDQPPGLGSTTTS